MTRKDGTIMSKKIIILNGSPRSNGNTSALIEQFTKGAEQNGHQVIRFDLQKMNIHPCLGCCKGGKDPASPCVQKDDMLKIYPHYVEADLVVLASPMYYWSISGQLKTAFDRLFAVAECNPNYANPVKDCVLLMAAEGDSQENFEPVAHFYHALLNNLGWKDRGIVYAGGNMDAGSILQKPEQLKAAFDLGASL
jgi:multimeric flavodoxin WrbA